MPLDTAPAVIFSWDVDTEHALEVIDAEEYTALGTLTDGRALDNTAIEYRVWSARLRVDGEDETVYGRLLLAGRDAADPGSAVVVPAAGSHPTTLVLSDTPERIVEPAGELRAL
jgi:hypothetical protein